MATNLQRSRDMNKPDSPVLLTKVLEDRTNGKETRLIIMANYTPLFNAAEVLSVRAEVANYTQWGNSFQYTSPHKKIDLTDLFLSHLPFTCDQFEKGRDINWEEVYYNHCAQMECVA